MSQTVIGVFNNADAARQAAEQLTNHGFRQDDVERGARATVSTENPTGEFPENDSLHRFLRAVFTSQPDSSLYPDIAQKGQVVTVHTHSLRETVRALDLLDDCGAVEVHELGIQHRAIGDGGSAPLETSRNSWTELSR